MWDGRKSRMSDRQAKGVCSGEDIRCQGSRRVNQAIDDATAEQSAAGAEQASRPRTPAREGSGEAGPAAQTPELGVCVESRCGAVV